METAEPDPAPQEQTRQRRCACCGYPLEDASARCRRCHGTATLLADTTDPLPTGRGSWPADFLRGLWTMVQATGQLLHHRGFVGQLKVPVLANLIAATTLGLVVFGLFAPWFDAWFRVEWPLLDSIRLAYGAHGAHRLTAASGLLLWPVWFETIVGPMSDRLVASTEVAVGGADMNRTPRPRRSHPSRWHHLHYRARLLGLQLVALPFAWALVLIPYAGIPLLLVVTSGFAAAVFADTAAARRGLLPSEMLADLRRNWPLALGFGLGCQAGLSIPPVNLLLLGPAAMVGATVLHFRFDKPSDPRRPAR